MTDSEKKLLVTDDLTAEPIAVLGRKYHLKEVLSTEGMKSVVWRGVDDFDGVPVAVKFATKEDYNDKIYLAEIQTAAKLHSYPQFAKYLGAEEQIINTVECVVFIEQLVEGITLDKFTDITPSFIESYIHQFSIILNILKENNLRHDDLNLRNIMIVPPLKGDFRNEYTLKVIDMGSLKKFDDPLKESKHSFDDLRRFVSQLIHLSNRLLFDKTGQRKPLSKKEKHYREVITKIIPIIIEDDKNVGLHDPEKILECFTSEFSMYQKLAVSDGNLTLDTPFDYISADHIGNDLILNKLFATSCPWLQEVKNNTPLLLTGPRGCGKSMIFRWLSFKSILARGDVASIKNSNLIGFYISCSADLRNRFSLYDTANKTAQAKEEIIHYFNLLLTRELVQTFSLMVQRSDCFDLFGISKSHENEVYSHFIEALSLEKSKRYLQGAKPFDHLYDIVVREMNDCYRKMLKREKFENVTGLTFLSDITSYLKTKIPFFADRTISFLLDDYSLHRISEPVQVTLNPILWDRQHNHIFKVSSEKFGMVLLQDNSSASYSPTSDLSREYREIDVGERYVNLSDRESISELITFCKELLDHRLRLAEYQGQTDQLIGNSDYGQYKTLERTLRFQTALEKKDYDEYHGIETISKICSGDISALLEIYRRIFKEGSVTKESTILIPKTKQHKAIQSTSRAFLDIIKTFNFGPDMYALVNSFGNLSRKILQEGKLQTGQQPNVTTRIEVDELEDMDKWKPEQRDIFLELIHRSIFISLEQGRGRRTLGSTLRIQLRRIYSPHFKTGLTKNTAVKLSNAEFRMFLSDPVSFCEGEYDKRWSIKNGSVKSGNLFDTDN